MRFRLKLKVKLFELQDFLSLSTILRFNLAEESYGRNMRRKSLSTRQDKVEPEISYANSVKFKALFSL